jgi:hypothetical protein
MGVTCTFPSHVDVSQVVSEVISRNRFGQVGFIPPRRGHRGRPTDKPDCPVIAVEPPVEEVSPQITFTGRLHVIVDRATLDVPRGLAQFVAKLLATERAAARYAARRRALGCIW